MRNPFYLYILIIVVLSIFSGCGESIEDRLARCEKENKKLTNQKIKLKSLLSQKDAEIKRLESALKKRGITIKNQDKNEKSLFDSVFN